AEADARLVLDRGEERDLAGGDAGLGLSLPPELAGDSQEHRAEPVGERERIQSPCPHQLLTRLTKLSSARGARTRPSKGGTCPFRPCPGARHGDMAGEDESCPDLVGGDAASGGRRAGRRA